MEELKKAFWDFQVALLKVTASSEKLREMVNDLEPKVESEQELGEELKIEADRLVQHTD